MTDQRPRGNDAHAPPATPGPASESITQLLSRAHEGQFNVWDRIYDLIYKEMHSLARSQIWRSRHHTLTPTALINETWLKLFNADIKAENRKQLISLMASSMRSVLLDEAKRNLAEKRGGRTPPLSLSDGYDPGEESRLEQLIALDTALDDLCKAMPRLAQVVEYRYFGGLQETEVAKLLDINVRTVRRDWHTARMFLLKQLGDDTP